MTRSLGCLSLAALLACAGGPEPPGAEDGGDGGTGDGGGRDLGRLEDSGSLADAWTQDAAPADAGAPEDAGQLSCAGLSSAAIDAERFAHLRACLDDPSTSAAAKEAFAREFIDRVEAGAGFPIRLGPSRFLFVYLRDPDYDAEDDRPSAEDFRAERRLEPIRVAFDLTQAGSSTLALAALHPNLYAAELTVAAPDGQRYRLVTKDAQGNDWVFSDPLSRRFEFDGQGRYSLVRGASDEGHLQWIRSVRATRLGDTRPVYLYVPPGYDQGTDRYSVLYMHDGNNLFHPNLPRSAPAGTWNVHFVMHRELQGGHVRPGLIVGIPNDDDRFAEYTHVPDDIGQVVGGRGDDYAHFVVQELKPLIDARYRTRPDRANTGVMGSSLGGLISFHLGQRHPEVFRFVGGLSSTFSWGKIGLENETMLERYAALDDLPARDQVFYLDSGGGPAPACPEGQDNYCEVVEMRDILVSEGVDRFPLDPDASPLPADTNIMHWWSPDAPHNEGAWFARVHRPLRLFFRPE